MESKSDLEKNLDQLNKTGKWSTVISFAIGTFLFTFFILTDWEPIIEFSIYYIAVAAAVNAIIFIILVLAAIFNDGKTKKYLKTAGLILLNIPIAIIYFIIVINQAL